MPRSGKLKGPWRGGGGVGEDYACLVCDDWVQDRRSCYSGEVRGDPFLSVRSGVSGAGPETRHFAEWWCAVAERGAEVAGRVEVVPREISVPGRPFGRGFSLEGVARAQRENPQGGGVAAVCREQRKSKSIQELLRGREARRPSREQRKNKVQYSIDAGRRASLCPPSSRRAPLLSSCLLSSLMSALGDIIMIRLEVS